jgi:hypothetical protein
VTERIQANKNQIYYADSPELALSLAKVILAIGAKKIVGPPDIPQYLEGLTGVQLFELDDDPSRTDKLLHSPEIEPNLGWAKNTDLLPFIKGKETEQSQLAKASKLILLLGRVTMPDTDGNIRGTWPGFSDETNLYRVFTNEARTISRMEANVDTIEELLQQEQFKSANGVIPETLRILRGLVRTRKKSVVSAD